MSLCLMVDESKALLNHSLTLNHSVERSEKWTCMQGQANKGSHSVGPGDCNTSLPSNSHSSESELYVSRSSAATKNRSVHHTVNYTFSNACVSLGRVLRLTLLYSY